MQLKQNEAFEIPTVSANKFKSNNFINKANEDNLARNSYQVKEYIATSKNILVELKK